MRAESIGALITYIKMEKSEKSRLKKKRIGIVQASRMSEKYFTQVFKHAARTIVFQKG